MFWKMEAGMAYARAFSMWYKSAIKLRYVDTISFPQYGNILENSDPSLVFCFMLTYTVATIMLAFALSTLFSR